MQRCANFCINTSFPHYFLLHIDMADLNRIDRAILTRLSKDARTTNNQLAEDVGLSQSACLERVRRLTETGRIRGSYTDVDPEAFGIGVQAIVAVQLKRHTRAAVRRFEAQVIALPQVVALYHVTGGDDFLAHAVAKNMEYLRDFTLDSITSFPDVARVETSLVFKTLRKSEWPDLSEGP